MTCSMPWPGPANRSSDARSRPVEQALPSRPAHGLEPRMGVELVQYTMHMVADGVHAQKQVRGDLLGRRAAPELAQNLTLAFGEGIRSANLTRAHVHREVLQPLRRYGQLAIGHSTYRAE